MAITVPGVPTSRKQPGILLNVVLGGPGTSAGEAQKKILLTGAMIAASITGASPSFTVTAGNYRTGAVPTNQVTPIISEEDAITRFGAGSELHCMTKAVFDQYPDAPLFAVPVVEPAGGTAATAKLYLAGTASEAGTLRLWIAGTMIDVNIPSGQVVADTVAAVTNAILAVTGLPVTAQYAAGPLSPVVLTAKHLGTRGNYITLRANLISTTATVDVPSTLVDGPPPANVVTLFGLTVGFSSISTVTTPTAKYMAGGVGDDASGASLTNALGAAAKDLYDRVVSPSPEGGSSNTYIDRLKTWLTAQAVPTRGICAQGVAAIVATLTAAQGAGTASLQINYARMQLVLHPRAEQTPGVIAAQPCAARLIGDVQAGGNSVGEALDVGANLDGVRLATITLQPYDGDRLSSDDPDTALQYGLTPLVASPGRAGYVEISRSITSRWKDDTGAPNYGVLDTSDVTVTDAVAARIRQEFAVTFKGYRLAPDSDAPPTTDRTTTPLLIRAFLHALLKAEEELGHVIEVDDRLALLKVQARTGTPWWINAEIPVVPIVGLHVFAANVRQLTARL